MDRTDKPITVRQLRAILFEIEDQDAPITLTALRSFIGDES